MLLAQYQVHVPGTWKLLSKCSLNYQLIQDWNSAYVILPVLAVSSEAKLAEKRTIELGVNQPFLILGKLNMVREAFPYPSPCTVTAKPLQIVLRNFPLWQLPEMLMIIHITIC